MATIKVIIPDISGCGYGEVEPCRFDTYALSGSTYEYRGFDIETNTIVIDDINADYREQSQWAYATEVIETTGGFCQRNQSIYKRCRSINNLTNFLTLFEYDLVPGLFWRSGIVKVQNDSTNRIHTNFFNFDSYYDYKLGEIRGSTNNSYTFTRGGSIYLYDFNPNDSEGAKLYPFIFGDNFEGYTTETTSVTAGDVIIPAYVAKDFGMTMNQYYSLHTPFQPLYINYKHEATSSYFNYTVLLKGVSPNFSVSQYRFYGLGFPKFDSAGTQVEGYISNMRPVLWGGGEIKTYSQDITGTFDHIIPEDIQCFEYFGRGDFTEENIERTGWIYNNVMLQNNYKVFLRDYPENYCAVPLVSGGTFWFPTFLSTQTYLIDGRTTNEDLWYEYSKISTDPHPVIKAYIRKFNWTTRTWMAVETDSYKSFTLPSPVLIATEGTSPFIIERFRITWNPKTDLEINEWDSYRIEMGSDIAEGSTTHIRPNIPTTPVPFSIPQWGPGTTAVLGKIEPFVLDTVTAPNLAVYGYESQETDSGAYTDSYTVDISAGDAGLKRIEIDITQNYFPKLIESTHWIPSPRSQNPSTNNVNRKYIILSDGSQRIRSTTTNTTRIVTSKPFVYLYFVVVGSIVPYNHNDYLSDFTWVKKQKINTTTGEITLIEEGFSPFS